MLYICCLLPVVRYGDRFDVLQALESLSFHRVYVGYTIEIDELNRSYTRTFHIIRHQTKVVALIMMGM